MAHGRSFAEVEEMTMAEVRLIFDYWNDYPPTNEVTAAVNGAGIFSKDRQRDEDTTQPPPVPPKEIEELRASLARNAHLLAR